MNIRYFSLATLVIACPLSNAAFADTIAGAGYVARSSPTANGSAGAALSAPDTALPNSATSDAGSSSSPSGNTKTDAFAKSGMAPAVKTPAPVKSPASAKPIAPTIDAARALRKQNAIAPEKLKLMDRNHGPLDLEADTLSHDQATNTVTATGHVELRQAGRLLKADAVTYDVTHDAVHAHGHVIFIDTTGDVHFADDMKLSNAMKDGFVTGLQSYLSAGGKFTSQSGTRKNATLTVMKNATYTTCDCDLSTERHPNWVLRAKTVRYDETTHYVTYRNAKLDMFGVPVFWTPYFAHPDGQVKQQSGLLFPTFGYNSSLGASVSEQYYFALAPDKDATLGTMVMTQQKPVALGTYRQRFDNAKLNLSGSATSSTRTDNVAGGERSTGDELRGHLFGDAIWDINSLWRAGANLQLTSDDQYLRQYNITGQNVLRNRLYAERFSGRNYALGQAVAFQDVRVNDTRSDQPNILPGLEAHFIGDPNQLLGGRWDADVSALDLQRFDNGQDLARLSGQTGWERRFVSDFGLVTTGRASVRGDAYQVDDHNITPNSDEGGSGTAARFYPSGTVKTSYPLAKPLDTMQFIVEPIASLTVAPNVAMHNGTIPNEDSQDAEIDSTNVFEANRFPGYDRIEDDSHVGYGVRTGGYGYDGSYGNVFLGQSYRFDRGTDDFPKDSGLDSQASDLVGEVNAVYKARYGLNYRFDLDNSLTSRRHELDAFANFDRIQLNVRYLFAQAITDASVTGTRQQLENIADFKITDMWKVRAGTLYDLGMDPGLRKALVGIDYDGCCILMSLTAVRNLTTESSGDSGSEITLRFGLKGLGEFKTSGNDTLTKADRELITP